MAEALEEAMLAMAEIMLVMVGTMQDLAEALDKAGALALEEAGEEDLEWAGAIGVPGIRGEGSIGFANTGES